MSQRHSRITRRSFLRRAGAAGAVASLAPQILPSGALGAANERLSIALLGSGGRTRQLLPSLLRAGENIVAVCDVNPSQIVRLRQAAQKVQAETAASVEKATIYEDYRKLLDAEKSVDAVVIASGQRWHVPMSKASLLAGKHVFCEKPLAHSVIEAREIQELGLKSKLAQQIGAQGGTTDTFRRSMEVIQAGLLGPIREVHCWINRGFPPSAPIDGNADPIPEGLNWDFWCGPSQLLPFKQYYLGGCLAWGRWLEFGDGHLADMGAHGLNLPWRALKLGAAQRASVEIPEPLKDSYPSATKFRWDFPAREGFDAVTVYWHDGRQAGPPEELGKELAATYGRVPGDGVLFVGEKGLLRSDAWGVGGVIKLKGEEKFRGVLDHAAAKPIPLTLPRMNGNHMGEWLNACRGKGKTFQGFGTAGSVAELAMVGIVALRLGKPIEWDSQNMKAKGALEADPFINRPQRTKWL